MSTSQANGRRRKNSRIATPIGNNRRGFMKPVLKVFVQKSLCRLKRETAYVQNDKTAERIGELEDVVTCSKNATAYVQNA